MNTTSSAPINGPLHGIRVLDLSRVLAGPWCSQMLGDLGAEVIKIEQPGSGDDTRHWGPPFLGGGDSGDSAYYSCTNRNKRSVAIDIASPDGADLVRSLAADADIVLENFRVGGLAKYGLDYASLKQVKPDLIHCSITGFGQDGPDKDRGGYDFLIQGMSGLMSVTGLPDNVPGGGPMKVGVPISDLSTGMYATVSILAALHHRDRTGEGQHIDIALLDSQLALMSNQAANWLNGGRAPRRLGNQHPNMVPYQNFTCADGDILIATANDRQFAKLCAVLGAPELAEDERFRSVAGRNVNRAPLLETLAGLIAPWNSGELLDALNAVKIPGGKINTVPEVLSSPQIEARGLKKEIARSDGTAVKFLGYPGKFTATPPTYRHAPPKAGEDTVAVLRDLLNLPANEIERLLDKQIIAENG